MKIFIKLPLVLMENAIFTVFPRLRKIVEKYIFNPYWFNREHSKYSQRQFQEFINKIGGIEKIKNKIIMELGPGGSIGFGLLALENGASEYYAVDDGKHFFTAKDQLMKEKIKFIEISQDSKYPLGDNSIDIIYSCAVLEHVHNLDQCFSEMTRVLRKGGLMNHEIDLRDHIFSQKSLLFLSIPTKIFKALFGKTGAYVNRKRLSDYEYLVKKNNLEMLNFHKTTLDNKKEILKYQPKFEAKDVETQTINLTIQKRWD